MTFHKVPRRRSLGAVARPSNCDGHKSPRINCCLAPAQFDAIADEAQRRAVSVSQIIRESVALRLSALRLLESAAVAAPEEVA